MVNLSKRPLRKHRLLGKLGLSLVIVARVNAAQQATNAVASEPTNSFPVAHQTRPQPASTLRMIERLNRIRETTDLVTDPYRNAERAELLRALIQTATNRTMVLQFSLLYANELLKSGNAEAALKAFESLQQKAVEAGVKVDALGEAEIRMDKAAAWMRLGEQQNCVANHNAQSCLFPLEPAAYHKLPGGSRGAIGLLNEQLQQFPDDLSARWLLNLAHMTLGEYPDRVPAKWLIPPKVFESERAFPRFRDVAGELGVDVNGISGGCILDDFDGDGLIDIVTSSRGATGTLHYFHNDGDGHFSDRTAEAGLAELRGGLNIQQTDYNNDGRLDIWVLRGGWMAKAGHIPPSLLKNNGDGTFTDVTEQAGLLSARPTQTSVWFDYDGDGWLDVFVGHETSDPNDPNPCELYHNNHDGTFTECAAGCGLKIERWVKGVAAADYDNDGRPDLYISCLDGESLLYHNDGRDASGQWKFSNVTHRAGIKASRTFPVWFFDYDNDGWEDIFVSGYGVKSVGDIAADYLGLPNRGALPALYHNNHDGTFTDVTAAAHLNHVFLTMGCNFGDLDNDGWLDFYLGTGGPDFTMLVPNRMFHNRDGKVFEDVTTAGGFGHLQKGHGVGFADLDNDGNQDIYEVMGGTFEGDTAFNVLYLNPGSTNHWLKLKLEGTKANRVAIGARIHLTVKTPAGPRHIYRTVGSGGSFGCSPLRQEIGLGDAAEISSVEIRWPGSGTRQVLTGLQRDHAYAIREGDAQASLLDLKRITFDLNHQPPHTHSHMMDMRVEQ